MLLKKDKGNAEEILSATLSAYDKTPERYKADATIQIGDLYLRTGDYEKGKEWLYKVIDSQKLGGYRYRSGYCDRSVAVILLANAAALVGRPVDVEELAGRVPKAELMDQVPAWYWNSKKTCRLRTALRFYEALGLKNAGDPEGARQRLEMLSSSGVVRVGDEILPLKEAIQRIQ